MGLFPKNFFLLVRRLVAFCYDIFLLFSVIFIVGAIAVALNHGESVDPLLLAPVTMLVTFVFFGWFWTHGGQTLGMRAWRLQLTGNRQHAVSWPQSIIRLAIMLLTLGAGTLWVLFNREGKSLQDMAASTVMHRIQKPVTA